MNSKPARIERAKSLRQSQTDSEGLLWSLLRSKQLCGLKVRRQHPIGPFFADFACQSHQVVIELDGEYHDYIEQDDFRRKRFLEEQGWKVIRFENDEVLKVVEAVARAIATELGIPYEFRKRSLSGSGMMSEKAPSRKRRGI